jgi:hypothetical protein
MSPGGSGFSANTSASKSIRAPGADSSRSRKAEAIRPHSPGGGAGDVGNSRPAKRNQSVQTKGTARSGWRPWRVAAVADGEERDVHQGRAVVGGAGGQRRESGQDGEAAPHPQGVRVADQVGVVVGPPDRARDVPAEAAAQVVRQGVGRRHGPVRHGQGEVGGRRRLEVGADRDGREPGRGGGAADNRRRYWSHYSGRECSLLNSASGAHSKL